MKLQKTETTKRLKTLTQIKNARATKAVAVPLSNRRKKTRRLRMKKLYTKGRSLRRGSRVATAPNIGTAASMATNVPVNIHWRLFTPPWMPISSRTGRRR